jgi:hypothetical protein
MSQHFQKDDTAVKWPTESAVESNPSVVETKADEIGKGIHP